MSLAGPPSPVSASPKLLRLRRSRRTVALNKQKVLLHSAGSGSANDGRLSQTNDETETGRQRPAKHMLSSYNLHPETEEFPVTVQGVFNSVPAESIAYLAFDHGNSL